MAAQKPKAKPKSKAKKAKDKKKKKSSKTKEKLDKFLNKHLLKICYAIAISDLVHALYFTLQATILLATSFDIYSIFAIFGAIFWVLIVVLLLIGLWKRRPKYVRIWLVFSIAGFIMDVLFLLWGITSSISIDWDRLNEFSVILVGIFVESSCIYFMYRYYLIMDPSKMGHELESGRKCFFLKKKKKKTDGKPTKGKKSKDKKKSKSKSKEKKPKKKK